MSFFENTRKPVGFSGKIMVAMMNFGHGAMAEWGLSFLQPAPDAIVLDCGCGGGANIKTLLKLPQRQGAGHRLLSRQRGKSAKGQFQSHCGRTVYRATGKCGRTAV